MGCYSWLRDRISKLFGWNRSKVGPSAATSMDFPGIDPNELELKTLARLMSMVFPRGTEDRWKCLDERMRQELAEPGESWEDKKPYTAKALLTKARKVYSLRKEYVELSEQEMSKYMALFDMLILGPEQQAELAGEEVGDGAPVENTSTTPIEGAKEGEEQATEDGGGGTTEGAATEPIKVDSNAKKDYSSSAMKEVSMAERAALGIREEGFEHGEIDPAAFFNFLFRLKTIHGHMLPPPKASKKKKDKDAQVVADSFYDIGCGCGKAVFAAGMFFEFKVCGGVEAIEGLYTAATELKERWINDIKKKISRPDTDISFESGDMMLATEWESGTYLFINGPTFSDERMNKLAVKFNGKAISPESVLIVVARPYTALDKDKWTLIAEDLIPMSWGKAKVFVYEKLPEKKKSLKKKSKSKRDNSFNI